MQDDHVPATDKPVCRTPWNKGKLVGPKPPLRPSQVWSIRTKLQIEDRAHVRIIAQAFVREQPDLVFGIDAGFEAQHQVRIGTGNKVRHQSYTKPVAEAREHRGDAVLLQKDRASRD